MFKNMVKQIAGFFGGLLASKEATMPTKKAAKPLHSSHEFIAPDTNVRQRPNSRGVAALRKFMKGGSKKIVNPRPKKAEPTLFDNTKQALLHGLRPYYYGSCVVFATSKDIAIGKYNQGRFVTVQQLASVGINPILLKDNVEKLVNILRDGGKPLEPSKGYEFVMPKEGIIVC